MDVIFGMSAMFLFPPLALWFFYSLNKKNLIWLAIPLSALIASLYYWQTIIFVYSEFRTEVFITLALHTAIVSAATVIAAYAKRKQKKQPKRILPAIIFTIICVAIMGLASHEVLLNTVNGYRQYFDRPAFTRLTKIQPEDIAEAEIIIVCRDNPEENSYTEYNGDKTFFAGLEYTDSAPLSRPWSPKEFDREVNFTLQDSTLQNGDAICFFQYDGDVFRVAFWEFNQGWAFFVKSPQLLADIT